MAGAPKPVLFLSHSSDDTDAAKAVAAALAAQFDVWLDANFIRVGDDWQEKVEAALVDCHCAIVLLSKGVIERPTWVSNEAYYLSLRRRQLQPSLIVLPLTLPEFAPADLDHVSLAPARLAALQALAIDPAALDIAPVFARLQPLIDEFATHLPHDRIEREVASKLEARLNVHARELVASDLGLDVTEMRNVRNQSRWLAAAMLRADFMVLQRAHANLDALDARVARDIFRMVAPYCWISREAAHVLSRVGTAMPPKQPLAMNAIRAETPRLYVRRASNKAAGWLVFDSEHAFEDDAVDPAPLDESLMETIRRQVANYLRLDEAELPSDAELMNELESVVSPADPVFIVLPTWFASSMDTGVLARLRATFPKLVFLMRTEAHDVTLPQKYTDLVLLPRLEHDVETRVYRAYARCLQGEPILIASEVR